MKDAPTWKQRVAQMVRSGDTATVRRCYDDWAASYDADHENFGKPLLHNFVDLFHKHVPTDTGLILDAAAGTGRMGEVLSKHGYSNFVGIDMSEAMLEIAKAKAGYLSTHAMTLGDRLDFDDEYFDVSASLAAFAPGHATHDAFAELIRVTKRGGLLVLALRAGCEDETQFDAKRSALEQAKQWQLVDEIADFVSHPDANPPLRYGVHIYRRL